MNRYGLSATVAALIVSVSYPSLTVSVEVSYPHTGASRVERPLGFDVSRGGAVASVQAIRAIAEVHVPVSAVTKIEGSLEWPFEFSDLVLTSDSIIVQRTLVLDEAAGVAEGVIVGVEKAVSDSQAADDLLGGMDFGKNLSDSQSEAEALIFNVSMGPDADTQATDDQINVILGFALNLGDMYGGDAESISFDVSIPLADSLGAPVDVAALGVGKQLSDTYSGYADELGFQFALHFGIYEPRPPLGGMVLNELAVNDSLEDQIQLTFDQVADFAIGKSVSDLVGAGSNITAFNFSKALADTANVAEVVAKDLTLAPFSDAQSVGDDVSIGVLWDLRIYEIFTSPVNSAPLNVWPLNQNDVGEGVYSTDELIGFGLGKVLSDSQASGDLFSALLNEFRTLNDIPINERSLN